ncbi:MAG: SMP-30/gluconolactonase/LRE family protein [Agriterribacter sp.]
MNNQKAILELDAKAFLAEGVLWHPLENRLYWVNIEGKELHLYDPETGIDKSFFLDERVGTVVPVKGGGALVALQNGIHFINTENGSLHLLVNPLPNSNIRFNDGKCDPQGRFWVGSMHLDQTESAASLYRLDTDGTVHEMVDQVTVSNGIAWTKDSTTMYYVDSPLKRIDAFDFDATTGSIANRRTIAVVPQGMGEPDGITIDTEGKLWVALWGGSCVARFDPSSGALMEKIEVAAPHVSSCTFGGKDLDILYISTAREGLTEEQLQKYPESGGLFSAQPAAKGVPANFYTGQITVK